MRNLTIKRAKSVVACLMKMQVYIEDHTCATLLIGDVPCRKLGELKNGAEAMFEIGNEAARVFVITDKLSRSFCNEYYKLEEGEEDVVLTGKNKFNPASGNAFRFDNNESEDVIANRKKSTGKGLIVLIIAALVGAALGFVISSGILFPPAPKTFSAEGMSITVTDDFIVDDFEYYTLVLSTTDVAVFAIKEEFTLFGDDKYTLEEYGELVIDANEFDVTLESRDGLLGFEREFTNTEVNETYRYYSYVYESSDAFWFIQFAVSVEDAPEYEESIIEWAKSVTFD